MIPRFLRGVEESLIALLLVAMTLLVTIEVILRYGFSSGLLWIQELTLLLAAYLVLLGAAYGVKKGAHIGMDMAVRRMAGVLAVLLCLLYCGLFIAGSWDYLAKIKRFGIELEDLPVPQWLAHGVLLVGFGLLVIRFLELLWKIINKRAEGVLIADEAADAVDAVDAVDDVETEGESRKGGPE